MTIAPADQENVFLGHRFQPVRLDDAALLEDYLRCYPQRVPVKAMKLRRTLIPRLIQLQAFDLHTNLELRRGQYRVCAAARPQQAAECSGSATGQPRAFTRTAPIHYWDTDLR